ncbi:MAG: FtsX-like permease family protein [Caldilineaceae bacterium]
MPQSTGATSPRGRGRANPWWAGRPRRRPRLQFNLTYRDALLDDERIAQGGSLFDPTYTRRTGFHPGRGAGLTHVNLGDTVTFRIQGVPLEAKVTSVRTRTEESVQPFFGFCVFPSAVLAGTPQTISPRCAKMRRRSPLQNRMVARFPNVSVIDVTAAIATFADLARRVTRIIRFFTAFSILAGLLIVVSAVFATRFARIQEAAYYKVLGAKSRFVLRVFTAENLLLGLVSALLGLGMAATGQLAHQHAPLRPGLPAVLGREPAHGRHHHAAGHSGGHGRIRLHPAQQADHVLREQTGRSRRAGMKIGRLGCAGIGRLRIGRLGSDDFSRCGALGRWAMTVARWIGLLGMMVALAAKRTGGTRACAGRGDSCPRLRRRP